MSKILIIEKTRCWNRRGVLFPGTTKEAVYATPLDLPAAANIVFLGYDSVAQWFAEGIEEREPEPEDGFDDLWDEAAANAPVIRYLDDRHRETDAAGAKYIVAEYGDDDGIGSPVLVETYTLREVSTNWDFRYDEEFPARKDIQFAGVLTDGHRFLFWCVTPPEKGNICSIHNSILLSEDSIECEYPWTPDNDALVTECLNAVADEGQYTGEESPLRDIPFHEYGYASTRIRFKEDGGECSVRIKLSQDYDEAEDGDTFFFCSGWHHLAGLMDPDNGEDFVVLDWCWEE